MVTKTILLLAAAFATDGALGFAPACPTRLPRLPVLWSSEEPTGEDQNKPVELTPEEEEFNNPFQTVDAELTPEEEEKLGNLVANEEWAGLSMELADVVRTAVVEDLKKNSRDFLGKEDYAVGDFSKEIDKRVKEEVAKIREKDDYEVSLSSS